jgi:hypothetical protein
MLSHIGCIHIVSVLLAYIYRPFLYIILCDLIYNIILNMLLKYEF